MDIFISWSGPRSRAAAEALKECLPIIVNAFNPWLSCADIDKGSQWIAELAKALVTAKAGIICLTPTNLAAPYILFEAGALLKTVEKTYVSPLLIDMEPSDVSGPLTQFQATRPTEAELLQLIQSLNKALGPSAVKDQQLEASFEVCWPKLKNRLENLPPDDSPHPPKRSDRQLLEELVDTTRGLITQNDEKTAALRRDLDEIVRILEGSLQLMHNQANYLSGIVTPASVYRASLESNRNTVAGVNSLAERVSPFKRDSDKAEK